MKKYVVAVAAIALALQGFHTLSDDNALLSIPKKEATKPSYSPDKGKEVYTKTCIACHQATGLGIPGAFPPLAKSDYLNANVNRAIKQVIKGSSGPMMVNGKKYTTPMPAQALSDVQIADVLTYVYSNWGNNNTKVTVAMVKAQRK